MNILKKSVLALVLTSALAACSTGSHVTREGTSSNPVWPVITEKDITVLGTFPNKESLFTIQKGMTRDQVYHLVGVPHFSEGFQVREWDYLLHFKTERGIESCQMKVLFDKKKIVQTVLLKPVRNSTLCGGSNYQKEVSAPKAENFNLSADALFPFNKGSRADLLPAGREKLAQLANAITASYVQVNQINLVGHTDRLGSDSYNYKLGMQRAQAVKEFLMNSGVNTNITVSSAGASQPVTQGCVGSKSTEALKACLLPDRRVAVEIMGVKK